MKILLLAAVVISCSCSGCVSHNLPKDAYLKGVKSKVTSIWATGELEVAEAATGTAAKNVTLDKK